MSIHVPIPVQPGMFRNKLAPAAAVCLSLASVLGLGAVLFFFDPSYFPWLTEKILRSGIRTASALNTWMLIHVVVTTICCICPGVTAWGMYRALHGNPARGMNFLSNASRWALRVVYGSAILVLGLFLYRVVGYVLGLLGRGDWLYRLFASSVMEGLMVAQAVFLYRMVCRFLDACEGCAASIGYTLSSGKLDPYPIPAFAATGLIILGIAGIVLSADRLCTMTIASDGFKQYYKFLMADHPGQWLCAATLLIGGIGDILLALYLRFYKRTSERALFFGSRME